MEIKSKRINRWILKLKTWYLLTTGKLIYRDDPFDPYIIRITNNSEEERECITWAVQSKKQFSFWSKTKAIFS